MKKIFLSAIVLLALVQAKAMTTEVYSLGELNNESFNATISDSSGSKLSCVKDKTFFFSSKQHGTKSIRDVYRILYRFPTLGLFGNGSSQFLSVGPMAQYEGIRSSDFYESFDDCRQAITNLFSQSSQDILTRVPATVSMNLELKMVHFPEQERCRRSVREHFSLNLGSSPAIKFLDILGLTQNNLATNEAFFETKANRDDCFSLPRTQ